MTMLHTVGAHRPCVSKDSTCTQPLERHHATFLHELGLAFERQAEEHHRLFPYLVPSLQTTPLLGLTRNTDFVATRADGTAVRLTHTTAKRPMSSRETRMNILGDGK